MSLIWRLVFLACCVQLSTSVDYVFPLNWQNTDWFSSYDTNENKWVYTFLETEKEITLHPDTVDAAKTKYEYIANIDQDTYSYYVRRLGSSYECVQSVSTPEAILHRVKELAAATNSTEVCPAAMNATTTASWLIKYPFNNMTDEASPIPSRIYQATYSTSAGDVVCSGDKSSVVVVRGKKIDLTTCYAGTDSYEKPMKSTLTMLAHVNGDILDSASNGDILLLGDFTTTPVRFYCARYEVNGTTVKLSLDISDKKEAKCTKSQTTTSSEDGKFIAFILKVQTLEPTTRPRQSTTTTTTTIKPTTTTAASTTTTTTTTTTASTTPHPSTTTTVTTTTSTAKTTTTTKSPAIPTTNPETATTSEKTETTASDAVVTGAPSVADKSVDIKTNNTIMLIVILLVILAVIITVIVIIAVVACQCRNRKKEEGILRNNFDTSFFGTKRMLPPGAVDGEELIDA